VGYAREVALSQDALSFKPFPDVQAYFFGKILKREHPVQLDLGQLKKNRFRTRS
jgi:hypothetical protein